MLTIIRERCDDLENPRGLENLSPDFSWAYNSEGAAVTQQSYSISVRKQENGEVVWNSREVESNQTHHISYQGEKLENQTSYLWQVTTKMSDGQILVGKEQFFETGISAKKWQAVWVAPVQNLDITSIEDVEKPKLFSMFGQVDDVKSGADKSELNPPSYLRRNFALGNRAIKKARLYMTAKGLYEVKINGQQVTKEILTPGFTSYNLFIEYQTYDVTSLLAENNTLDITLGDGWYKGKYGILGFNGNYGKETAVLYQLEVTYEDGTLETICSDGSEVCTQGPIRYSDFLGGERFEAGLSLENATWQPCYITEGRIDNLVGKTADGVEILERRKPVSVLHTPAGETVLDMGQNIVGFLEFPTDALEHCEVKLEYAEILDPKGNFLMNISGFHRDQCDIYIAGEKKSGKWHPTFSTHGFRYVRITSDCPNLDLSGFVACVVGSKLEYTGKFDTSDARLNRLQSNIFWSQRGNLVSIPTDCPQRERAGWTGDTAIFCNTAAFNMDMQAFYRKWLKNVRAEQYADGQVPIVVPWAQGYRYLQLDMFGSDCSAGWSDVIVELPWMLYTRYGNKSALSENYEAIKKWLAYVEKEAYEGIPEGFPEDASEERKERQKYLWNTKFHYGDWLFPSCKNENGETDMFGSAARTKELVATALFARSTELAAKIAEILGDLDGAAHYFDLNAKIRKAYEEEYVDENGHIANHLQGLYVLTLAMHMVSEKKRPKVAKQLVDLIHANGDCLDTGFMSIRYLLDVLCEEGYADVAKKVLFQKKCPGWMYEIENGATTIWETWDAIGVDGTPHKMSYNHFAFGCVGDFMYRKILGVTPAEPGYATILVDPVFAFGLSNAGGEVLTVNGKARIRWNLTEDGRLTYNLEIPANGKLKLLLPKNATDLGTEGVIPVISETGDGRQCLEFMSGSHQVTCNI